MHVKDNSFSLYYIIYTLPPLTDIDIPMNVYYKYTNIYTVIDKFKRRALVYVTVYITQRMF